MRIAILEDRDTDAAVLSALLARFGRERSIDLVTSHYFTPSALLRAFEEAPFDVAFLDIYLCGNASGMAAARQLQIDFPNCRLIFATSSHAHAVESYAVRATYYLTKPLNYNRLCDAMALVCKTLQRDGQCLSFTSHGIPATVPLREIAYADSLNRVARVHLSTDSLTVDMPMNEVLRQLLEHDRFLLCNRNLAVNMDCISEAQDSCFLLKSGQTVPIRQRGRREVRQAYLTYRVAKLATMGGDTR